MSKTTMTHVLIVVTIAAIGGWIAVAWLLGLLAQAAQ